MMKSRIELDEDVTLLVTEGTEPSLEVKIVPAGTEPSIAQESIAQGLGSLINCSIHFEPYGDCFVDDRGNLFHTIKSDEIAKVYEHIGLWYAKLHTGKVYEVEDMSTSESKGDEVYV